MAEDPEWLRKWRKARQQTFDLQEEALPIVRALRDGDLKPLAGYLRAGGVQDSPKQVVSVPQELALEIAAMIEKQPWCWFSLEVKGRRQNEQGWTREMELEKRDFTIGYFMVKHQREQGRGSYEGVLQDAEAEFRVDRATVKRAHAFVKNWIHEHRKWRVEAGQTEDQAEAALLEILDWHHERDMQEHRNRSHD